MMYWSARNDTAHPWPQDLRKAFDPSNASFFMRLPHVFQVFLVRTMYVSVPGSMQRRIAEALVQQALDAAARASKGFSLNLCTLARPHIGDLLAGPLQAAVSIPQV